MDISLDEISVLLVLVSLKKTPLFAVSREFKARHVLRALAQRQRI